MGRRKFSMRGKQFGRNMLFTEYIRIAYEASLMAGELPRDDVLRHRKKVSSHLQVLKNFMKSYRCCELCLPTFLFE